MIKELRQRQFVLLGAVGKIGMGLAYYNIVARGEGWTIKHDGKDEGDYATKESAFEAAVAAASLAIREGHEVTVSVPGRGRGNGTALGEKA